MDYFSGFSWAVPTAFADAVALCRFEEGDILYDSRVAYEKEWDEARNDIRYSLQVKYPNKVVGTAVKDYGSQFRANWVSELRLDFYENHEPVRIGQTHTTQGRLYTMLWRGDVGILDTSTEEPSVPLFISDVTKMLRETSEIASHVAKDSPVFIMAVDRSSAISRNKTGKITASLGASLSDYIVRSAERSGLQRHSEIAPTLEIAYYVTRGLSRDELHDKVKTAVYVPNKKAQKDMFSITRHGMIL